MSTNVGSLISTLSPQGRGQGEGWGTRVAIIDLSKPARPREITYATLDARCDAIAAGLAARGLGRGDRVGILALNRTEYIEALYGTMRAGAIPVPLSCTTSVVRKRILRNGLSRFERC